MHLAHCLHLNPYVAAAAFALVLSALSLMLLPKTRRQALQERLSSWLPFSPRGRRNSSAKTPPRSFSPEKRLPNNGPDPVPYKDCFPPSGRELLAECLGDLPEPLRAAYKGAELDQVEFKKNLLPFTADYREYGPSTFTPTEYSIEEVKALGDFPDYSRLSGVDNPRPYKEFKIEKAIARPYRPLRWAYHQTMCRQNTLFFFDFC